MTSPERIKELYERYTNATATRAELAEFFNHAADPTNEPVFESLMSGSWDELYQKGKELQDLKSAPVRPTAPVHSITPVRTLTARRYFRRIAAAAIAIILTGSGTYIFLTQPKKQIAATKPAVGSQIKNDILPGTNKAILTLGNGSKIILDSAHNGLLANQSGSSIIKTDSGKINYTPSGAVTHAAPAPPTYNILTTPRGGQYQLQLPDGTKVWLNAASSITYPTAFATTPNSPRKVTITGEVYFEVTHNSNHPFKVIVNGTEVEDLGTHFNINAYDDELEMKTTLLEGAIQITNAATKKTLKPGQQIQINREGEVSITNHADLDKAVAWKNGLFNFNGADLETMLRQLSRWYDIQIKYEGAVPQHTFEGKLDRQLKLSEIIEILGKVNVQFRIEGKTLIVTK